MTQQTLDGIAKMEREGRVVETGRPSVAPIAERVSEREFMAEVIALAKRNGWRVFHVFDSRRSEAGWPDLFLVRASVAIAAELKVGDNLPTAAQLNWLDALAAAGIQTFVWRPSDFGSIEEILR